MRAQLAAVRTPLQTGLVLTSHSRDRVMNLSLGIFRLQRGTRVSGMSGRCNTSVLSPGKRRHHPTWQVL